MERRPLAMRSETVAKVATAKGQLSIVTLVKEDLAWFILKPRTDLCVFIFRGREFQSDDTQNAKLVLCRSARVRGKTELFALYRAGALFRRSHTY